VVAGLFASAENPVAHRTAAYLSSHRDLQLTNENVSDLGHVIPHLSDASILVAERKLAVSRSSNAGACHKNREIFNGKTK
jgi:hypothetical protein